MENAINFHTRFTVKKPKVLYQEMEDEIIIIHMETGNYYSLKGTARALWKKIEEEAGWGEILNWFKHQYEGPEIEKDLVSFVQELADEKLIFNSNSPETKEVTYAEGGILESSLKEKFHPPQMDKFTDMQEFLSMDPIHEVDERGWPYPIEKPQENPGPRDDAP